MKFFQHQTGIGVVATVMRRWLSCLAALVPSLAWTAEPVALSLTPAEIQQPVLQHRLWPTQDQLKPGNAAPILLRLPWEQTQWITKVGPTLKDWSTRPLDAPEWVKSHGVLPENFYSEMRRAAYRRDASWEYPIGETDSSYSILLPDVQGLRLFLDYGLSARIRYHLSQGEWDQAREGILVGFANSAHLARTPFYVVYLNAGTIRRRMLECLTELISQPDCPNLYWSIAVLPSNTTDFEACVDFESTLFLDSMPGLRDLDQPRDATQWREIAAQLSQIFPLSPASNTEYTPVWTKTKEVLEYLGLSEPSPLERWVTVARQELPTLAHVAPSAVLNMVDDEVAVRWFVALRQLRDQQSAAVMMLPPQEAWEPLDHLEKALSDDAKRMGIGRNPWISPRPIFVHHWGLRRKIASLRTIEAIRHHMAIHNGQLPPSLDAITSVPVPMDPMTNKPFEWQVTDGVGTLRSPSFPEGATEPDKEDEPSVSIEYRIVARSVKQN